MRSNHHVARFSDRAPRAEGSALRFLFYSHDGMGLGHIHRNLAIARELTRMSTSTSVLLATGTDRLDWVGTSPQVDFLKIPELRKVTNRSYASRRLRLPEPEILEMRSSLLTAAVRSLRPHVVLVDKHPLGVRGELTEALTELNGIGGSAVLGLRDILDAPETVAREWSSEGLPVRIADYYGSVLIYGQHELFDPITQYGFPPAVAARTSFCGYVLSAQTGFASAAENSARSTRVDRRPLVLATAGGGEDGFLVLETFVRACAGAPWQGLAIGGPLMPAAESQVLRRMADQAGVLFETSLAELGPTLGSVDATVCMGGYNTLLEALASAVPVVCVPRNLPRVEQLLRATVFQRSGLLEFIEPQELNPHRLRELIDAALGRSRQDLLRQIQSVLRFGGARSAATHLLVEAAAVRNRWRADAPSCGVPAVPILESSRRS